MPFSITRHEFPVGFQYGSATAACQVEGSQYGNHGPSHWDSWSQTLGNVVNADNRSVACDHYLRFEQDLAIATLG